MCDKEIPQPVTALPRNRQDPPLSFGIDIVFPLYYPVLQEDVAQEVLFRVELERPFLRELKKPCQVSGPVIMGVPSMERPDDAVRQKLSGTSLLFHKERQAL